MRKQGNQDVLNDKKNFRDSFDEMMASVKVRRDFVHHPS